MSSLPNSKSSFLRAAQGCGALALAGAMVFLSIVSAYTIPSSSGKGGDVIMEQAQQEEKTNPYNIPVGTAVPQSGEAPAATDSAAN